LRPLQGATIKKEGDVTLLSDKAIVRHMQKGSIVIDPFHPERLNTDSYDLELGPYFWRYSRLLRRKPDEMEYGKGFSFVDAREEGGILLKSQERVLGHTAEIAGGRTVEIPRRLLPGSKQISVTTHIQATSTAGRHGISSCLCAGYGDVGYVNFWTLEITNHTLDTLWLPVGAIIAQVAFTEVEPPSVQYGSKTGNYVFDSLNPKDIRERWKPEDMLPKRLKVRGTWRKGFS
jgi:dCTP deaminase